MRGVTVIVFFMLALAAGGMMFAPSAIRWMSVLFALGAIFMAYVIWGNRRMDAARPIAESAQRRSQQPGEETE